MKKFAPAIALLLAPSFALGKNIKNLAQQYEYDQAEGGYEAPATDYPTPAVGGDYGYASEPEYDGGYASDAYSDSYSAHSGKRH